MLTRRGLLAGAAAVAWRIADRRWHSLLPGLGSAPRRIVHLHPGGSTDGVAGARLAAAELQHTAAVLGLEVEVTEYTVSEEREIRDAIAEARAAGALGLISTLTSHGRGALAADGSFPVIEAAAPLISRTCVTAPFSTGIPVAEAARSILDVLAAGIDGEHWVLITPDEAAAAPITAYVARRLEQANARLTHVAPPDDSAARVIVRARPDAILMAIDPRNSAAHALVDSLARASVFDRSRIVALSDAPLPVVHAIETLSVVAWHPRLFRFGAAQLSERYRRAVGRPMTSEAWCAWVAVKLLGEAVLRRPGGVISMLADPRARFDGHKGTPLAFRTSDRWLRQPLYVTRQAAGASEPSVLADVAYADGAPTSCLPQREGTS